MTRRQFLQAGLGILAGAAMPRLLTVPHRARASGKQDYNPLCGYAILVFADGYASTYHVAFPKLEGWPAVALIVPTMINTPNHMTEQQCSILHEAGWDLASHGYTHDDPTLMSPEELDEHLRLSQQWLLARGFDAGARHYGPPGRCNEAVRDAALAYYDTVTPVGLGPYSVLPDGPAYVWQSVRDEIPWPVIEAALSTLVNHPGEVVILLFHNLMQVHPGSGLASVTQLDAVIDYLRANSINVVDMSSLLDAEVPMHRIFADGFESGDLSAWDGIIGAPTVSASAALVGAYGCEISGKPQAVREDLDLTRRYRVQFRLDPSHLSMGPGAMITSIRLLQGEDQIGMVALGRKANYFTLSASIRGEEGMWYRTRAYPIAAAAHLVEADFWFDADGHLELWIDGTSKERLSGLSCGSGGVDSCQLGQPASNGAIGGVLYIDHFITDRADYIGV